MLVERRRHAQDDCIALPRALEIRGGLEPGLTGPGNAACGNMLDIALAGIELANLVLVDVDTQHAEPDRTVAQHQGQPDIAQADDADNGLPVLDPVDEVFGDWARHGGICFVVVNRRGR
ncbi:hypothetical protein D3C72_1825550 [compost metagenome]